MSTSTRSHRSDMTDLISGALDWFGRQSTAIKITIVALIVALVIAAVLFYPRISAFFDGGPSGPTVTLEGTELVVAEHYIDIPYDRDAFGPTWTDSVDDVQWGRNGCDTRNDMLADRLQQPHRLADCTIIEGTLVDPYTGNTIDFIRGPETSSDIQIDHVVSLANAWSTGAAYLSPAQRRAIANDPRNLEAVDGPTNSAKGDSDASQWLPPAVDYHCTYVRRQIEVKDAYQLWVTREEASAMLTVLYMCVMP